MTQIFPKQEQTTITTTKYQQQHKDVYNHIRVPYTFCSVNQRVLVRKSRAAEEIFDIL